MALREGLQRPGEVKEKSQRPQPKGQGAMVNVKGVTSFSP